MRRARVCGPRACKDCKQDISHRGPKALFCGRTCATRRRRRKKHRKRSARCEWCRADISGRQHGARFCGDTCAHRSRRAILLAPSRFAKYEHLILHVYLTDIRLPAQRARTTSRDDLLQAGAVGLLKACARWERSRKRTFPSYACQRIRWAMLEEAGLTGRGWRRDELLYPSGHAVFERPEA